MPTNAQPPNPIARLFKADLHRDLFRVLADSLDEAVFVISADGQRLLAGNHAFLLLSGHSQSDLQALTPADLFPGAPGEHVLARLAEPWDAPETSLPEVPLRLHEGDIGLVDLVAYPVGSPRQALLVRARLSDERLHAETRTRLEHERLARLGEMLASLLDTDRLSVQAILAVAKSLLEAQALGLYRVSPAGPDYILQGAMPEAFPESLPASALDPLHRPGVWSLGQRPDHALHRAARQAALGVLRTEPLGTDVAWIGVLVAGWHEAADPPADAQDLMAIIALVCHAAILLGLQSAGVADLQRSILQLEGEIRGQFAAVNEGVLSLDESLHVVRANPASARLLGYEQKEIEGVAVQDVLVGPDDLVALLLDALGHERKVDQKRLTFHRRDGTPFPAQLRAVPLSREGRPRLLLVISDHTERQAIEDQTEVLTQRALLGEVSAIFAHEVRNPINNISTGVQLVASRLGDQHPLHESLDRVRKECVRLDQLMQDVLFFARPLELKMEPLDLIDVMKRLLARWQPRLNQANVRTHTTLEAGTPRVLADPRTLEQVLVNLIANAVQAMADGGTLSVAAGRAAAPNVGMIELKVADTGPGIPQDLVDRVFDPFFTTKKEGTGLGLAISRRIVNAHKGHIRVESYPGAGTVFTIQLPAAPPPAEVAT